MSGQKFVVDESKAVGQGHWKVAKEHSKSASTESQQPTEKPSTTMDTISTETAIMNDSTDS